MKISAILLAAGSSSRMGQSKQLLKVGDITLLNQSVQTIMASSVANTIVVLGANASAHQEEIKDLPVDIVINENWNLGMGASIKSGVRYLLRSKTTPDAVIILVCDQLMLTSKHIDSIIEKFKNDSHSIVASSYANTLGVPVLFHKRYFDHLINLNDHHGAKTLIDEFSGDVTSIPFPEGNIDLDTPSDYQSFINKR